MHRCRLQQRLFNATSARVPLMLPWASLPTFDPNVLTVPTALFRVKRTPFTAAHTRLPHLPPPSSCSTPPTPPRPPPILAWLYTSSTSCVPNLSGHDRVAPTVFPKNGMVPVGRPPVQQTRLTRQPRWSPTTVLPLPPSVSLRHGSVLHGRPPSSRRQVPALAQLNESPWSIAPLLTPLNILRVLQS